MPDFEPVFRDGIGYCNLGCPFTGTAYTQDTDLANDNKPFRVCRHTETQKHSVCSRDDRTVCIPWVRSLLDVSSEDSEPEEFTREELRGIRDKAEALARHCYRDQRWGAFCRRLAEAADAADAASLRGDMALRRLELRD